MTREEAIYELQDMPINYPITNSEDKASRLIQARDMAIEALSEPKQGEWIEEDMFDGDVAYRCSCCDELFCIIEGTPKDNEYNFCPNCGARMGVSE